MQEEDKNLQSAPKSWGFFIMATLCTLPFVAFSLLHVMATSFKAPMVLSFLKFSAAGSLPFLAIAGSGGLIFIGFALKQQPRMWPILILYAVIILRGVLAWMNAIANL